MIIRIIDVETTGVDPLSDRICEIAAVDVDTDTEATSTMQSLIDPLIPIPCTASAVHHITDEMVRGAPKLDEVIERYFGADIYVAHNNRFDEKFLPPFKKPWIDTLRCAYYAWPDAPSFSNQALSYWLKAPRPEGDQAHRALFDCWTTFGLLSLLAEKHSIYQLLEWSSKPATLPMLCFGKHAGKKFSQVDIGYLLWMLGQDFDEDVMFTARAELKRRNAA